MAKILIGLSLLILSGFALLALYDQYTGSGASGLFIAVSAFVFAGAMIAIGEGFSETLFNHNKKAGY